MKSYKVLLSLTLLGGIVGQPAFSEPTSTERGTRGDAPGSTSDGHGGSPVRPRPPRPPGGGGGNPPGGGGGNPGNPGHPGPRPPGGGGGNPGNPGHPGPRPNPGPRPRPNPGFPRPRPRPNPGFPYNPGYPGHGGYDNDDFYGEASCSPEVKQKSVTAVEKNVGGLLARQEFSKPNADAVKETFAEIKAEKNLDVKIAKSLDIVGVDVKNPAEVAAFVGARDHAEYEKYARDGLGLDKDQAKILVEEISSTLLKQINR